MAINLSIIKIYFDIFFIFFNNHITLQLLLYWANDNVNLVITNNAKLSLSKGVLVAVFWPSICIVIILTRNYLIWFLQIS